jgi:hypothetical protein
MAANPACEREAEAVGVAMPDRKAVDRELAGVDHLTCRQRSELQRNRRLSFSPQPGEHPDDDVEGAWAAVDRHDVGALPDSNAISSSSSFETSTKVSLSSM